MTSIDSTRPMPGASLRQTAIAAYREDLPGGDWEPPSPHLAGVIAIASLLQATTEASAPDDRSRGLLRAADMTRELLGPEVVAMGCRTDPAGLDGPVDVLRLLGERTEVSYAHHRVLAGHIYESLRGLLPRVSLESGRVLAHEIRNAALRGQDALTLARAKTLVRIGRQLRNDELLFRGWSGIGSIAQLRGNIPRGYKLRQRSLRYAERSGEARPISLALVNMAAVLGMLGRYDESVACGWRALQLNDHPDLRAIALGDLGETFYRTGHIAASRAARAVALKLNLDFNAVFVNLGGYAATSAILGDLVGATWASLQALALAEKHKPTQGLAQGLLGCADACGHIGLDDLARKLYQRGLQIADAKGYHDLRFRADPTQRVLERFAVHSFDGAAEEARRSIFELAPDGVSHDFTLVGA